MTDKPLHQTTASDEEVARLVEEDRRLRMHIADIERDRREIQQKLERSDALIKEIVTRHAQTLLLEGQSHKLVDLLTPDMTDEEQAAVWMLIRHVKKRIANNVAEVCGIAERNCNDGA